MQHLRGHDRVFLKIMFTKILSVVCLFFLFAGQASAQSPQVPPEKNPQSTTEPQEAAGQEEGKRQDPSIAEPEVRGSDAKDNGQESTEQVANNRISLFGYSMRFTDFLNTIFAGLLTLFTLVLAASTIGLWKASNKQAAVMKRSVRHASRSASAMENVAKGIAISAETARESTATLREVTTNQMRAFLTVEPNTEGIKQSRKNNLRFEGQPIIVNTGSTPAYNIEFRTKAEVIEVPLPKGFKFKLPTGKPARGGTLGPQRARVMNIFLENFIDDDEVDEIASGQSVINGKGKGRVFCVWGIITYDDITGKKRKTKFCQYITWVDLNKVNTNYPPVHNSAD